MKKIVLQASIGIGIFTTGVILGKQIEKKSHNDHTTYAGTLQIHESDVGPELYLALSVPPEKLQTSTDVIFKVNRIKTK